MRSRAWRRELGVRLLARTTRSVAPTEAGATLLERLRPALGEIELALEAALETRDRPAGNLRITMPRTAAHLVFAPTDRRLRQSLSRHHAGAGHRGPLHRRRGRRLRRRRAARRKPAARHDRGEDRPADHAARWSGARPISGPCRSRGIRATSPPIAASASASPAASSIAGNSRRTARRSSCAVDGPLILGEDRLVVEAAIAGAGLAFVFEDHVGGGPRRRPAGSRAWKTGARPSTASISTIRAGGRCGRRLRAFVDFFRIGG